MTHTGASLYPTHQMTELGARYKGTSSRMSLVCTGDASTVQSALLASTALHRSIDSSTNSVRLLQLYTVSIAQLQPFSYTSEQRDSSHCSMEIYCSIHTKCYAYRYLLL
jgi:hypothetical protein